LKKHVGSEAGPAGTRDAFKALSNSLIEYVSKHPALAGTYRQVHCPMANADWLQKEATVNNPYFGKEMPHCAEFIKNAAFRSHDGEMFFGFDRLRVEVGPSIRVPRLGPAKDNGIPLPG